MQFWRRLVAAMLCAAMLIGLGLDAKSPISVQAEALGPAALPVAALAAFVTAAGVNWSTTAGADQVPDLITRLWDEYRAAHPDVSVGDGVIPNPALTELYSHITVSDLGRIILDAPIVARFRDFVAWLQSDKSVAAGETVDVITGISYLGNLPSRTIVPIGETVLNDDYYIRYMYSDPNDANACSLLIFPNSYHGTNVNISVWGFRSFVAGDEYRHYYYWDFCDGKCCESDFHVDFYESSSSDPISLDKSFSRSNLVLKKFPSLSISSTPGLSLVGASAIDVPGQGMADTDSVALDIGATAGATADDIAAAVAAGIAAGTFTASATVEAVEPVPGGNADIDGLGLPSLGALLLTRFPFSIPWDIKAVVSLLSADAQAPYWSVDLMQPLKARGVNFKGDTTINIDLRDDKWAVIGQVSRWGTLISFCLALAVATKRLIWTA